MVTATKCCNLFKIDIICPLFCPGLGAGAAHDARLQGDGLQLVQHPRPPSEHGGQTQGEHNVT